MQDKKYNRTAYNVKSREKHGKKAVNFTFDAEMLALMDNLVQTTGQTKIAIIKLALIDYAQKIKQHNDII